MKRLKSWLKQVLPRGLVATLLPTYHRSRAMLAGFLYGFPARQMKVVAVTGTNGKTTTCSYIASILRANGWRVGVSSTAYFDIADQHIVNDTNMTVTDPFRLNRLLKQMRKARVEWVVLEVTSHALSQNRIHGIPVEAAVITNLTQDHLDYHGTMEQYAAAKAKLLAPEPRMIVLNRDDEWFDYFNQFDAGEHKMSFGVSPDADCRITEAHLRPTGSSFQLEFDKNVCFNLETKLVGKFNVYNATAAAAVTYLLHVSREALTKGIAELAAVPGRMESIVEGQSFDVIVDYAHTPDALQNLLETLQALAKGRIILVFGATGDRDRAKRPDMGKIAAKMADRIVLTDEEPYHEEPADIRAEIRKGIAEAKGEGKTREVPERRSAIEHALKIARPDDIVVITGMGHQSYMTVGDHKIPWDDRAVARELLTKRATD